MKGYKKLFAGIGGGILIAGAFVSGHYAGAASKTPGSTGDPLITLSYLEERLGQTQGGVQKVMLKKGQTLEGVQGTGIVVLGGSVTAEGSGLVDLTAGSLTENGTSMFSYHNYIIAEDDAGCQALSGCTLLVSGKYTVKERKD